MAGKSPARKGAPSKAAKPAKGTKSGDAPVVAPKVPRRQDLGIGNLTPEHVTAIRHSPKAAPRGDGLGSARTGRKQDPPRNAAKKRRNG